LYAVHEGLALIEEEGLEQLSSATGAII